MPHNLIFGKMAIFLTYISLNLQKQRNIMKANLTTTSPVLPADPALNIRNVLKLIGMKEVATNVFSLPTKNK
ncbi:hypothetical protein GCM10027442_28020 [Emticicia fontis]